MKAKYIVPLLAFLGLAALLGVGLQLNPRALPSTFIGKPAPMFELSLLGDESSTFTPADYKGKRWILNVWASWCVSCRYEHPLLNQIAEHTDVPLIGLNYKDKAADAKKWLAERGNPYDKIPFDLLGDAGIEWGVYGVPETFVIDETGKVIYKHAGPITADIVQNEIAPLLPAISSVFTGNTASR